MAKSTPTKSAPAPAPKPAPAPVAPKAAAPKVVAPKVSQSVASPFLNSIVKPQLNNMAVLDAKTTANLKASQAAVKKEEAAKKAKLAADVAKTIAAMKKSGKDISTPWSQSGGMSLSGTPMGIILGAQPKPKPKVVSKDRPERLASGHVAQKPPTQKQINQHKGKTPPKKTAPKKTAPKKTTPPKVVAPPIPPAPEFTLPEIEIPIIDATPYTPPSSPAAPKPDTKPATPDLIMTVDEAYPVELIADLLYEDVGGTEILNIARHDLVEGAELSYQQISNIARVGTIAGGANLQALTQTSEDIFNQFPLRRYHYVPSVTDDPSGLNKNVYLNSSGDLVIELQNVDSSYQLDVAFQVGSVNDIIY